MLKGLLLRRALHGLLLVFAVSLLSFAMLELAPGDFLAEMRLNPQVSPSAVAALRAQHGLDRPLVERYGRWLVSLSRGELGYSFAYGLPVGDLVWPRARHTLLLAGAATLVAWAVALPLGTFLAWRRGSWADRAAAVATSALLAIPELLLALLLLLFALLTGLFPVGGMVSPDFADRDAWGRALDVLWHLPLPVAALALSALPTLLRHVRSAVAEVLDSPFLRAARAHGIPRRRLLLRHALPAAGNPLASLFGLSVAGLLSSSLIVEVVFSWPGLGPLLLEAILARDIHLVIAPVLLSTVLLVLGNLTGDLLLYAVDPRLRGGATP